MQHEILDLLEGLDDLEEGSNPVTLTRKYVLICAEPTKNSVVITDKITINGTDAVVLDKMLERYPSDGVPVAITDESEIITAQWYAAVNPIETNDLVDGSVRISRPDDRILIAQILAKYAKGGKGEPLGIEISW